MVESSCEQEAAEVTFPHRHRETRGRTPTSAGTSSRRDVPDAEILCAEQGHEAPHRIPHSRGPPQEDEPARCLA